MPINIYKENSIERIAYISENDWSLPKQVTTLEQWLLKYSPSLPKEKYVIDIEFSIRLNASSGGSVITAEMMKLMAEKGFDLFLSEYSEG